MNIIKHWCTITKHKKYVFIYSVKAGIPWRGLLHDLSKYSFTEFFEGAKFFNGTKSPNEVARAEHGYSQAWMHHKGRNRHHFEYWTDYSSVTKKLEPVKMPMKFLKEMFCDRVAAGRVYLGDKFTLNNPIDYFRKGRAKDVMHPETAAMLEKWLVMLQEKGEKETFKEIRKTKNY